MKRIVSIGLALLSAGLFGYAATEDNYLARLQSELNHSRDRLPATTASAEQAAQAFLAGGNLWAAGRQADFISEMCGRAGGLMPLAALGKHEPKQGDVVLLAVPGRLDAEETEKVAGWQKGGVTVVGFASDAGLYHGCAPLDTVLNAANGWVWTGEFVAACTRKGKMPILYLSYGLPGGLERGRKYQGQRIHGDFSIQPIPAGNLGKAYLGQIQSALTSVQSTQMTNLVRAASAWRSVPTSAAATLVIGHLFPRHLQDPRVKTYSTFISAPATGRLEAEHERRLGQFNLYLGYQYAPQSLIDQTRTNGTHLVYVSAQSGQLPAGASNVVYLNPGFPLTDACVTVPGYDIPILPASGVVQAALYWSLVAEREKSSRDAN